MHIRTSSGSPNREIAHGKRAKSAIFQLLESKFSVQKIINFPQISNPIVKEFRGYSKETPSDVCTGP